MIPPSLNAFPALCSLLKVLLDVWPAHEKALNRGLYKSNPSELAHAEIVAALINQLVAGRQREVCEDYFWTCERLLEEELYFQRNDHYRNTTFADVEREVYANHKYMNRYVNGLLLSHLFWTNHRQVLKLFAEHFLANNQNGYRHLEVGPGHGLLLFLAASDPKCGLAEGWDVSSTSISHTRDCLERLDGSRNTRLEQHDILAPIKDVGPFDSVVISEVLEHLERPADALKNLRALMSPKGRLFVNMPINSPAPDHIYLLSHPEAVTDMVKNSGFTIVDTANFPALGQSIDRAIKNKTTISCVVVAVPD